MYGRSSRICEGSLFHCSKAGYQQGGSLCYPCQIEQECIGIGEEEESTLEECPDEEERLARGR